MFDIAVIFLVLTALLAYCSHRFLRLPTTIGVMAIAMLLSFVLIGLDRLGISGLHSYEVSLLSSIDFSEVLMQGMLSMLLFAGALHVDLEDLRAFRWQVAGLAIVGTIVSTAVVGFGTWSVLSWVGIPLPLSYCLVFGALISPTDPISVIGILKSAGAPKSIETLIVGESLFNDGLGVVLFTLLLGAAASNAVPSFGDSALLLAREAGGGIAFGLVLGYATYRLLKSIDSYQEEVLLTLAAVLGGYALASRLHVSGPLAMVVAGLIVGNHGRASAMSHDTERYVDMFWELLDSILNAVLFVLVGLEVVLVHFSGRLAGAAVAAVVVTLMARFVSVGLPVLLWKQAFSLPTGAWRVLTWGGLRGGISVALVLSLPASEARETILALTYCVVVFSVLVQGLTVGGVARRLGGGSPSEKSDPAA
ncbi:MAG: sodium:proton antiporter [Burkholderiaceae bacterium]